MNKSILIGNGLNRCEVDNISADDIISRLSNDCIKNETGLSFSLRFESLINDRSLNIEDVFLKIRDELKILNKQDNEIYKHYKSLFLEFDSIITTNYDFAIENNIFDNNKPQTKAIGKNKGYEYISKDYKKIFHIHGDLNHYSNFCLGFYGYQKYVRSSISNLKQNLNRYQNDKDAFINIHKSLPESIYSLLVNDIYILGLNLYESELLLWNTLTIRKELIRLGVFECCNQPINKIVFYQSYENEEPKEIKKFYSNFSIDSRFIKLEKNDYKGFYMNALKEIDKDLK